MLKERVVQWTQEWLAEGKRSLLKDLFEQRFGQLPAWAVERLEGADAETLDRLGRRIFDAQSLDDIFSQA